MSNVDARPFGRLFSVTILVCSVAVSKVLKKTVQMLLNLALINVFTLFLLIMTLCSLCGIDFYG